MTDGPREGPEASGARLAIDIGGTFTDVALDAGAAPVTTKVPTTPAAPEDGVLAGVRKVLEIAGVAPSAVRLVIHGTTLATNAIIERRGARTALIVTSGHRDALEMAREDRFEQYDIGIDRPKPLVPRRLRLPVTERVDHRGRVLVPLDEASVRALPPVLDEHGVESVAVGLIHGYANPDHERRVGAILADARPGLSVTLASDVCPEVREYERLSTACANAYVQPLMSRYLKGLAESLTASGFGCPFLLMTSAGGLATLETAMAAPVRLVESGPAGGAILASRLARRLELGDVLSFDMGGTTAKLCVIDGGRPLRSRAFEVARSYRFRRGSGLPVRVPVVEMVEIGAGGGSIATVDDLGRIEVGPASAGSEPGPAAYGRGGADATVTDADVVLGRIEPSSFAGGAISLDRARATAAVRDRTGARLGLDETSAALGISEMVDENMSNAARTHALEWGRGLTGRTLVAFGGAAPIHAARVADKLELDRFMVPAHAGVGSAVGFLLAPISYEVVRSRHMRLSLFDADGFRAVVDEMRAEATAVVARGAPGAQTTESVRAHMRYVGQGHEIGVEVPRAVVAGDGSAGGLRRAFDRAYGTVYGRVVPGLDVEVLSWTLVVTAEGAGATGDVLARANRMGAGGRRGDGGVVDAASSGAVAGAVGSAAASAGGGAGGEMRAREPGGSGVGPTGSAGPAPDSVGSAVGSAVGSVESPGSSGDPSSGLVAGAGGLAAAPAGAGAGGDMQGRDPAGTSCPPASPTRGDAAEGARRPEEDPPGGATEQRAGDGGPAPTPPRPVRRAELVDGAGGDRVAAAVHLRGGLGEGARVAGPALVVEAQTTTVVPGGWGAVVLPGGHLLVERDAAHAPAVPERASGRPSPGASGSERASQGPTPGARSSERASHAHVPGDPPPEATSNQSIVPGAAHPEPTPRHPNPTSHRPQSASRGLAPESGAPGSQPNHAAREPDRPHAAYPRPVHPRIHDQIMWRRLLSVVEEQARTLVRTAFSTPVREAGDLSAGVFDLSGRMLAQAVTGTPGHVNAMAESVGFFLRDHPVPTLVDGDVLVTNDPWEGTGHLNDFTVVTPAFVSGRPVALFAATSHIADVGGRGFGADANQVFEEGVRIPIGHLMRAGRVDETLIRLVRANVRDPDVAEGDLYSLAACNRTGCERLTAMMAEFGLDSLNSLAEMIVSTSRRAMLARIRALRRGTYRNHMRIDGYDHDLDLACALTVHRDGIRIDFDGSAPMSPRGINVPLAYTRAYASFGVRCVVGSEIPNNAGSLGAISVTAPNGSILNAPPPAAVAARHAIGQMLPDVVLGCLEQAMEPGSVPAEGASCLWNPVLLGGPGLTGPHPYGAAEPFVVNPFHTGGTGARPGKDGLSATAFPSGVRSTPIEITETVAPLVFWRKEYIPDSGGPGEFRGGLGQVMEIAHASGAPFAISKMFERVRNPARSRAGGQHGAMGRVHIPGVGALRAKGREIVPPGHRVVLETPGGGGLGDPRSRPRERVRDDVLDGYVTEEAAARDYGL